MKYPHIVAAVHRTPWMIREEKLREILAFIDFKANGGNVSADDVTLLQVPKREPYLIESMGPVEDDAENPLIEPLLESRAEELSVPLAADPSTASRSRAGAIAVLPLYGTISQRMDLFSAISGGTSTEQFTGWLRAALNDPQVTSIVMDIDSPGGTVTGVQELADEIYQGRQQKSIIAVANSMSASAAYYLGSQASEFVVSPSGEVGSIGVFAAHEDVSQALESAGIKTTFISAGKYKTEGNPYEPLSTEARDSMQAKVDAYYQQFVNAVARGRNVTAAKVEESFGQGRMVMSKPAKAAGMVDRIATLDQTLKRLGARSKTKVLPSSMSRESAETAESAPQAEETPTAPPAYLADLERRRKQLDLHQ
jgi:signal peptide peptidase SppA